MRIADNFANWQLRNLLTIKGIELRLAVERQLSKVVSVARLASAADWRGGPQEQVG